MKKLQWCQLHFNQHKPWSAKDLAGETTGTPIRKRVNNEFAYSFNMKGSISKAEWAEDLYLLVYFTECKGT